MYTLQCVEECMNQQLSLAWSNADFQLIFISCIEMFSCVGSRLGELSHPRRMWTRKSVNVGRLNVHILCRWVNIAVGAFRILQHQAFWCQGEFKHFKDWIGLYCEGCCGRWGSLVCAFLSFTFVYNTQLLDANQLFSTSQPFELCKLVRYCDVTKFFALFSPLP